MRGWTWTARLRGGRGGSRGPKGPTGCARTGARRLVRLRRSASPSPWCATCPRRPRPPHRSRSGVPVAGAGPRLRGRGSLDRRARVLEPLERYVYLADAFLHEQPPCSASRTTPATRGAGRPEAHCGVRAVSWRCCPRPVPIFGRGTPTSSCSAAHGAVRHIKAGEPPASSACPARLLVRTRQSCATLAFALSTAMHHGVPMGTSGCTRRSPRPCCRSPRCSPAANGGAWTTGVLLRLTVSARRRPRSRMPFTPRGCWSKREREGRRRSRRRGALVPTARSPLLLPVVNCRGAARRLQQRRGSARTATRDTTGI